MDNLSMGITAFSGTLTGAMGGSGKVVSAGDAAEEQRQCESQFDELIEKFSSVFDVVEQRRNRGRLHWRASFG